MLDRLFNRPKETPHYSVFVVEDDPSLANLIVGLLKDEGYTANTAASAEEALRMLAQLPAPDAMIVDYVLPEMNGRQFIESARLRYGRGKVPPVLMLTASQDGEATAHAVQADDYLPKPFNNQKLVANVRGLIENAQRS